MAVVRSTVIMKTDMRGSTARAGTLSMSDLSSLLEEHNQLILDIAAKHEGSMVKGEGDSFWIIFPSVTSASLAALAMQEELQTSQASKGEGARLAVRIVITLGDVLHQEKDIFGNNVTLAARIEGIAPANEIYLSHAAWLALNKAEVQTSFVNDFVFKGFSEPEKVYRILREHKTRIIKDQILVFTDLRHSSAFFGSASVKDIEELLVYHENLHTQICEEFAGTIRSLAGDECFITFADTDMAIAGLNHLRAEWEKFLLQKDLTGKVPIAVGVHKGEFCLLAMRNRSIVYSWDVNVAAAMQILASSLTRPGKTCLYISGKVRSDLIGMEWENRLRKIEFSEDDLTPVLKETYVKLLKGISVYEIEG